MPLKEERSAAEVSPGAGGHASLGLRLPVLMYHRIAPDPGTRSPELTVSPEQFKLQLDWLKRHGYSTVRPSDLEPRRTSDASLPQKAVLLTFDDAHESLVEYAFPQLLDHGFGAALFVVTGCIGKTNEWDRAVGWGPFPLMTAAQIRHWAKRGIEVGAHSRTHPDLRRLGGAELVREIAGSRVELEDLLGEPVRAFAYPFGYQEPPVVEEVRKHYQQAFLAGGGINRPETDLHLLRRVQVGPNDGGWSFHLLFATGWTPGGFLSAVSSRARKSRLG